jgi:hypothetical protein
MSHPLRSEQDTSRRHLADPTDVNLACSDRHGLKYTDCVYVLVVPPILYGPMI